MNATDTVCDRPIRDQSHVLIDVNAVLGSLALFAVLMRVFIAVQLHNFGYDDLCACLAGFVAVPHFVGSIILAMSGLGRDIWTLAPGKIIEILKVGFYTQSSLC
jgi:hypothetical protein